MQSAVPPLLQADQPFAGGVRCRGVLALMREWDLGESAPSVILLDLRLPRTSG